MTSELTPYLCVADARAARGMMAEEFPEAGGAPPAPDRGAAVTLHLTVPDVDAAAARVTATGTDLQRGPEDTPHGRVAVFTDPSGHRWFLEAPTPG